MPQPRSKSAIPPLPPELKLVDRSQSKLFSDYDYAIRYHPGKENVVADALSRKERIKPNRVRAMNMILQSRIKDRILATQKEAVDEFAGLQKGLDEMIKQRSDGTLYYLDRIWVPLKGEVLVAWNEKGYSLVYRDSRFTLRFWQSMQEALGNHFIYVYDLSPQYPNGSAVEHTIQTLEDMLRAMGCAPFEALYGRKCRSPIMWAEDREGQLIGPELVQETTEKISQIKDRLKVTS
ncbi:putative reverse transcriptase domain-containing protein [Tanacetum coccineum]